MSGGQTRESSMDRYTLVALTVSLVIYPLLYSLDFFTVFVFPLLSDISFSSYLGQFDEGFWWFFWLRNIPYHWVPFFFIWLALYKNKENWNSIGLNLEWYAKYKYLFIFLLLALVMAAFILPEIYYQDPNSSTSETGFFFAPVTTTERLLVLFMAFTAGVTEEVIFRGFALTRLKIWISNPWFILPITLVSFLLIHGQPEDLGRSINYVIAGCAFGIPFILLGLKRLDILILIHFLIDASMVIAP